MEGSGPSDTSNLKRKSAEPGAEEQAPPKRHEVPKAENAEADAHDSAPEDGQQEEEEDRIDCVCGVLEESGFMIACDDCDGWSHGRCVGLTRKTAPRVYYCAKCAPNHPAPKPAARPVEERLEPPVLWATCPVAGRPSRYTWNRPWRVGRFGSTVIPFEAKVTKAVPAGPDNLVCAMANGRLVNYNLDTLEVDSFFSNCQRPIAHLDISEGIAVVGEWVSPSERATVQPPVHLWDVQGEATSPTTIAVGGPTDCVCIGKGRLAVGSGQSTVVWDVPTATSLGTFSQGNKPGEDDVVDALLHDCNSLLSLSLDSNVKLFDIRAGKAVVELPHPLPGGANGSWSVLHAAATGRGVDGHGLRIMANHSKSQLAVLLRTGVIDIWDVRLLQRPQHTLRDSLYRAPDTDDPMSKTVGKNTQNAYMLWDFESDRVVSSFNNRLRCWSSATGEQMFGVKAHADIINSLCFLNSTHVATGSSDRGVTIWDLETAEPCYSLIGHAERVHHVLRSGTSDKLVSIDAESSMRVWDFSPSYNQAESSMALVSLYRAKLAGETDIITSMEGSDKPGIAVGASMFLLRKAFNDAPPASPDGVAKSGVEAAAEPAADSALIPVWLEICRSPPPPLEPAVLPEIKRDPDADADSDASGPAADGVKEPTVVENGCVVVKREVAAGAGVSVNGVDSASAAEDIKPHSSSTAAAGETNVEAAPVSTDAVPAQQRND